MNSPRCTRQATAAALAAAVTILPMAAEPSPQHQGDTHPITGLVSTDEREPLADAAVTFFGRRPIQLDWLARMAPPADPVRGTTDARGQFRLGAPEASGSLLVTHPDGVGALVHGMATGAPERITVAPLATLEVDGVGPGATIDVLADGPDGTVCYLGRWQGDRLRLPAGTFRLLVQSDDRVAELGCVLRAGQRALIEGPTAATVQVVLSAPRTAALALDGWNALQLPTVDGRVSIPAGPRMIHLRQLQPDGSAALDSAWIPADARTVQLPTVAPPVWRTLLIQDEHGRPLENASVQAVVDTTRGRALRSLSLSDASGNARAVALDGEGEVLVHRHGMAFAWTDLPPGPSPTVVRLRPGHPVDVLVRSRQGVGVGGVRVELRHGSHRWLVLRTTSDRRGRARLRDLPPGRATLAIVDGDHLPVERDILVAPDARGHVWQLLADPGVALSGRVEIDGKPVPGAIVTLRDTGDEQGGAPRAARADDRGRFAFTGLSPDAVLTLSATFERNGMTWSAQRHGVQAEQGNWLLDLRLEDPPPPFARTRKKGR